MKKIVIAFLTCIAGCIFIRSPAYAANLYAEFSHNNSSYSFDINENNFTSVPNAESRKAYTDSVTFVNHTPIKMDVNLAKVELLEGNNELYKKSDAQIYDKDNKYFDGSLSDSKMKLSLNPGERKEVTFNYIAGYDNPHVPDNTLMGTSMKYRLTFVGEYSTHQKKYSIAKKIKDAILPGYTQTGDERNLILLIIAILTSGFILLTLRKRKKNERRSNSNK